ncbi:MAG: hypothetical protein C5B55_01200 [Blastocatellia bacterium]|nr:MAG: hypothetical protein C5B55_01200 [Blastocatellia bacterium]
MADYIKERSSGEVIRDSVKIYWSNFATIFAIYFFNGFMWDFLFDILKHTHTWPRGRWGIYLLSWLMPFVAGVQLTVVISQIYLGYELNFRRAFRDPSTLSKAVVTALLVALLFPIYPLTMFSVPIVVLEGVWGFNALRRSYELGTNYYVRNFLVLIWPYTIMFLLLFPFAVLHQIYTSIGLTVFVDFVKDAAFSLITPLLIITSVLLYFDMRIRNEAYDIVSLAEELKK